MYAPIFHAIRDFFRRPKWAGDRVLVVFAGPDRAHTEASKEVRKKMQGKKTRQQIENAPVPVPFLSLSYSEPRFDQTRDSRAWIRKFAEDRKKGTAKLMRFPKPMTSEVQVDLWCGEGGHLIAQSIQGQTDLFFPHESVYLDVDWTQPKWYRPPFNTLEHAKVYGKTKLRLISEGWQDTSNLEMGSDPKEVRRTWSGRAEFYIPYRPEEGRLLRTLEVEIIDNSVEPEVVLETIIGGSED